jgi:hypothetical protein
MSLMYELMANMIQYKNRTYLMSTAMCVLLLIPEPQTYIAVFIDYVYDNTYSQLLIITDQQSTK